MYSSCCVVVACRLTHHLFCLPVLAVSCRIVLICAKRSLYAAFSVLPYGESAHLRYKESTNPKQKAPTIITSLFTFVSSLSLNHHHRSQKGTVCVCVHVVKVA